MSVYRFKIYWEEDNDVERIILIKPNQTFYDFYTIITESFELNNKEASSSFFTSDDYWDKHIEITLKEEDTQQGEKLMHKTSISSLIEQPKQKFIFVYDEQLQLTFYIELIKIEPDANSPDTFPKIISAKNKIPKRIRKPQKANLQANTNTSNTLPMLSDDEIDQMIYANLMKGNVSDNDILNDNMNDLLNTINQPSDLKPHDESDEPEEIFDEDNDVFDADEFNQNEYFESDDNEEN
ncbi:MAG: plasmid pRiA4b ORF-3 family protein [Bacteroidia bacterium]|nr:plasmid pRiA4b ORF-3 family protein [Bacteroidia bacterium]